MSLSPPFKLKKGVSIISHPKCFVDKIPVLDCDGSVKDCLNIPSRPPTPEATLLIKKWNNTQLGDHRIFHAMVKDPQLERARNMVHGKKLDHGYGVDECIHPKEQTPLKHAIQEMEEAIYASNVNGPLEKSHKPNLPEFIDPVKTTLGLPCVRDDGIGSLINPEKRRAEILQEELEDRRHYLRPFGRTLAGEQSHRNYSKKFDPGKTFGMPMRVDNTGIRVKRALNWTGNQTEKMPVASELLMAYFDKNRSKDGIPLDPMRDTMKVPPDFTFGQKLEKCNGSVSELLHGYAVRNILGLTAPKATPMNEDPAGDGSRVTLTERENVLRAILKKRLRQHMFKRGPEISAVLCQLSNGNSLISEELAQAVFEEFNPPLDEELREELFDVCRLENFSKIGEKPVQPASSPQTGGENIIDWKLMASLLDWNRLLPSELNGHNACMEERPCVPKIVETAEEVRKRLAKAINARILHWTTTNQTYQGDRNGIFDSKIWRPLGCPSLHRDLIVPSPPTLCDIRNYADLGGVGTVLNPALMTCFNIGQRDMFILREKDEVKHILEGSGVINEMESGCQIDDVWRRAKELDQVRLRELAPDPATCDRATLDSVRAALRECNFKQVTASVAEKYKPCCN